jgi:hypothetical protein
VSEWSEAVHMGGAKRGATRDACRALQCIPRDNSAGEIRMCQSGLKQCIWVEQRGGRPVMLAGPCSAYQGTTVQERSECARVV